MLWFGFIFGPNFIFVWFWEWLSLIINQQKGNYLFMHGASVAEIIIIIIIYSIYRALIPSGPKAFYIIKITTKS